MSKKSVSVQTASLKGLRETNEDQEIVFINLDSNKDIIDPNYAAINLFIICDGHGGGEVSKMVSKELEKAFKQKTQKYPLSVNNITAIYDDIDNKLKAHPLKIGESCGSTALAAINYIDKQSKSVLQVINLGDCRAVMSNRNIATPLTYDHKPSWPTESERIKKINSGLSEAEQQQIIFANGDWRIDGLAVSRAFGDFENLPYVSHEPECYRYLINEPNYLILACDGLWDVMSNQDVINYVIDNVDNKNLEFYPDQKSKDTNIAKRLAKYALEKGSTDNVSVILVKFD